MENKDLLTTNENHIAQKVAVLFTDMKGSSAFYKTHGNLAGRIMIQKLNDILFPIVKGYHGTIVKTIGDSIMAYFRDPKEALWASIAMQKRLRSHNKTTDTSEHLLIRIAVNFGNAIVEEKDVFGDVVNIAGKLITCCEAQQILLTDTFYQATRNAADITFTPVQLKQTKEQIADIAIYQVEWKQVKTDDVESEKVALFSLRAEHTSSGTTATFANRSILPMIKRAAEQIVTQDDNEINAIFSSAETCLRTAQKALQTYLLSTATDDNLPAILKIGLHSIAETDLQAQNPLTVFERSIAARSQAEPYEIIATHFFLQALDPKLQQACTALPEGRTADGPLYRFASGQNSTQETVITSLLPAESVRTTDAQCFYCGSSMHATKSCPSKLIRTSKHHLEKLGYLPLSEIRTLLHEHFSEMVRPLLNSSSDDRFDILLRENQNDPFSLAIFSLYEITEFFQLRTFAGLFQDTNADKGPPLQKIGALRMGEDCLRVSRFDEAADWFAKAAKEHANDFRPYVALGILALERAQAQNASTHFKNAIAQAQTDKQKAHLHLLTARVYELSGGLPHAQKEVDKALVLFNNWHEARYYLATLLVKSGQTNKAIAIFKNLITKSPRFYLMVSLNPNLAAAKKDIMALLNRELVTIRERGKKSLKAIEKKVAEHKDWFGPEDPEYKAACDLVQKARDTLKNESISGLMDIPGFEATVGLMIKRALDFRKGSIKKRIASFEKKLTLYSSYISRFPYKSLVKQKDLMLATTFEHLIDDAHQAAAATPPPSPAEAQELLKKLQEAATRTTTNRNRLDITKNLTFVGECAGKIISVFVAAAMLTALFSAFILLLYKGYESSFSSITGHHVRQFISFGFFTGIIAGLFFAGVWLKKNFSQLHKKIE
ncbi:MAG: hypothetical protein GY868_06710 [Deltaproteobacteria bacterium]|nr:hypothetical protein [Deltaproteobacteria bacterium]